MRETPSPFSARFAASLVALLVVTSVLGPIGAVSAQTVSITQTATTDTTVAPGETVTVQAAIDYDDVNSPGIDVTLPENWTVVSHTDDGGTYGPPQPAWAWLEGSATGVAGNHTVTYTVQVPGDAAPGDYTITAEGSAIDPSDNSSVTATDTLTVTVEESQPANQPPVADAGNDQTVAALDTVQLDASGSTDPDGDSLSFDWAQTAGPAVPLSDNASATPTFPAPDVGSETVLSFAVDVSDGNGGSDTDVVNVTVQPPGEPPAPNVTVTQTATSPTTVAPGGTVTVEATIDYSDVNSPAIDVSLPAGWSVVNHTDDGGQYGPPQPAWVWQEGDADGVSGSHTVSYEVEIPAGAADGDYALGANGSGVDPTDSSVVDDTDSLTVTVQAPENQPPVAAFAASPTPPEAGETVNFDATGSTDPDGSIASYEWTFGDGDTATGQTATHAYDAAGTYQASLTVTDDDGATNTTTQTIQVTEPPAAGPGTAEILVTPNSAIETSTYNGGSYQIANTGDKEIAAVTFDLSTTAMPDMVFDPQGTAGDQAGKGFTPDSGGATVGLVDGSFAEPHNGVNASDGYDALTVTFDDFQSGESFAFSADNDPTSIKDATLSSQEAGPISGLELARATVTVEYADGTTQETQLMGDGSAGGAHATLSPNVSTAPSIDVAGVSLDGSALDAHHSAATVADATQTVTVTGPANAPVTLLRVEGELELDNVPDYDGSPGYDIEAFEANHAEVVEYYSTSTGPSGTVDVPVTLTNSTAPGGLNYFVAAVEDGNGTGAGSNTVVLEYAPGAANEPPTASFSVSPTDPQTGESVSFDATGSSDADGSIASYAWDFGDGATATGATPSHTYSAQGTYTVTLTVTDDDGATNATSQTVTVSEAPNQGPTAAFTVTPSTPEVGQSVTFDAGDSTDPDGTIASYDWTMTVQDAGPTETVLHETSFEGDSLAAAGWTHVPIDSDATAGVSSATANSGTQSAYHAGESGSIVSPAVDANASESLTLEYWVQKGDDAFSENPDAGSDEDLVVEALAENGTWVEVDRIEDSVADGAEFTESLTVSDAGLLHDAFQLRFRQQSGSGGPDSDYWHVDDVAIVSQTAGGSETLTATGETTTQTFDAAGTVTVELTVTDDDGATATATQTVTVDEAGDGELSVTEAVASMGDGDDSLVSTSEIQQAIDLWVEDDPVPDTGGETISTTQIQQLIDLWVEDDPVGSGGGS